LDTTLNCVDWSGRPVTLSQNTVDHIAIRHVEMAPFLRRTCDVLETPGLVHFRSRTQSYLFYKLGILDGRLYNTYMVVIVAYDQENNGTVSTAYPTTRPARGDIPIRLPA